MSNADALLPPNATAAEFAVSRTLARQLDVPVPARDLWNADTCPADLLPWLAWGLSIDSWNANWPEHIKRSRVRTAIAISRRKGTSKSVRDVVAAFGGGVEIREWFQQDPPAAPYTFDMILTLAGHAGEPATAQFVAEVLAAVDQTKPARSHYTFTQGVEVQGGVGIAASARVTAFLRLTFNVPPEPL